MLYNLKSMYSGIETKSTNHMRIRVKIEPLQISYQMYSFLNPCANSTCKHQ